MGHHPVKMITAWHGCLHHREGGPGHIVAQHGQVRQLAIGQRSGTELS